MKYNSYMKHLPNALSIVRILISFVIPVFVALDLYIYALIFFFLAGISDYFDGYFARKFSIVSKFGEIIDPIADKILIVCALIILSVELKSFYVGFLSSIVISREIWVSALRDYNSRFNNTNATKVLYISKVKTSIQLATIMFYLLGLALKYKFNNTYCRYHVTYFNDNHSLYRLYIYRSYFF